MLYILCKIITLQSFIRKKLVECKAKIPFELQESHFEQMYYFLKAEFPLL